MSKKKSLPKYVPKRVVTPKVYHTLFGPFGRKWLETHGLEGRFRVKYSQGSEAFSTPESSGTGPVRNKPSGDLNAPQPRKISPKLQERIEQQPPLHPTKPEEMGPEDVGETVGGWPVSMGGNAPDISSWREVTPEEIENWEPEEETDEYDIDLEPTKEELEAEARIQKNRQYVQYFLKRRLRPPSEFTSRNQYVNYTVDQMVTLYKQGKISLPVSQEEFGEMVKLEAGIIWRDREDRKSLEKKTQEKLGARYKIAPTEEGQSAFSESNKPKPKPSARVPGTGGSRNQVSGDLNSPPTEQIQPKNRNKPQIPLQGGQGPDFIQEEQHLPPPETSSGFAPHIEDMLKNPSQNNLPLLTEEEMRKMGFTEDMIQHEMQARAVPPEEIENWNPDEETEEGAPEEVVNEEKAREEVDNWFETIGIPLPGRDENEESYIARVQNNVWDQFKRDPDMWELTKSYAPDVVISHLSKIVHIWAVNKWKERVNNNGR